jgi:hypothetical protein
VLNFEVLVAVLLKIQVFWDVTRCLIKLLCVHLRVKQSLLPMSDPDDEDTTVLRNVDDYQSTRRNIPIDLIVQVIVLLSLL